jgi:hypothetical protein
MRTSVCTEITSNPRAHSACKIQCHVMQSLEEVTARDGWVGQHRTATDPLGDPPPPDYMAYLCVQSLANWLYRSLSVLYMRAISGTSGSSGFGSVSSEQIDSSTLLIVSAGDHCDRRISRHMLPLLLMFG